MVARHYKIYALYNDFTDDTYVGYTCLGLNKRSALHRHYAKMKETKLYTEMRKIKRHNFKIVELLFVYTDFMCA